MCVHGPGGGRCRSARMYRSMRNEAEDLVEKLQDEVDVLKAKLAQYDNMITWDTTCRSCAGILDSAIRETNRAEKAEAALAALEARSPADSPSGELPGSLPPTRADDGGSTTAGP